MNNGISADRLLFLSVVVIKAAKVIHWPPASFNKGQKKLKSYDFQEILPSNIERIP